MHTTVFCGRYTDISLEGQIKTGFSVVTHQFGNGGHFFVGFSKQFFRLLDATLCDIVKNGAVTGGTEALVGIAGGQIYRGGYVIGSATCSR